MSTETLAAKEPKRARGKQRVASLLDAGAAVFAEKGYEAATMTEIAQRAGAAIGSLYQFFPSKEALAEALFSRYSERGGTSLARFAELAPGLSPAELADLLVDHMLDLRSDRDAMVAISTAVTSIIERRKPLRDAVRRALAAIVAAGNPALTETQAAAAAAMISHMMKTVPLLAAEQESGLPLLAEVRTSLSLYIGDVLRRGSAVRLNEID